MYFNMCAVKWSLNSGLETGFCYYNDNAHSAGLRFLSCFWMKVPIKISFITCFYLRRTQMLMFQMDTWKDAYNTVAVSAWKNRKGAHFNLILDSSFNLHEYDNILTIKGIVEDRWLRTFGLQMVFNGWNVVKHIYVCTIDEELGTTYCR